LQSAYEIRIAEEKAGREIARLPVRAGATLLICAENCPGIFIEI
jgi:hypothetical protein